MSNNFQDNILNIEKLSPGLKQGLDALNFTKNHTKTLFFTTHEETKRAIDEQKYSIRFYLEKAKKVQASAVFFKLFKDRPPVPQIYIYDFTRDDKSERDLGEIHKNVWNTGDVPLIYIFTKTQIKIINCLRHPVKKNEELVPCYLEEGIVIQEILHDATVINDKLKKYSAELFYNGTFWEKSNNRYLFASTETVNELLLKNLTDLREYLLQKYNFEGKKKKIINKMLIQCILIKYLEERVDINDNPVFPSGYFKQFEKAANFCDVLQKGIFLDLCDNLETKFNGKIFQWSDNSERKHLKLIDGKIIANFLYAKIDSHGQYWLWRMYSFKHLPVELISHIYDHFLGENKIGKVYTPIHLATLLIDQSMPIDGVEIPDLDNYKILDPSCGSGVFLVLCFKRLVQWWIIANYKKTGIWQTPDSRTIKRLLQNSIFGVDIDVEAVQLTVFSLSLALCGMLSPPEIWNKLRFNDLTEKNVFEQDFFAYLKKKPEKFDLIIGNPPFISRFETEEAVQIENERITNYSLPKTPDKQAAFLFLEQSLKLVKTNPEALLCLLIPATFLYSNKNKYRKYIFENNNVAQIIDFSYLSNKILFPNVSFPVLAIFIKNNNPIYERILHLIIKRTMFNKNKLYFEIDDYDFNYVDKQTAVEDDYIWKCNFLGGGRIHKIIQCLKKKRTLGEYLADKKKNDGWLYGEGYTVGHRGRQNNEKLDQIMYRNRKRYQKADYITGKPTIDSKYFTEDGISQDGIKIETEKYFEWPRNKKLFEPPHLLIKENIGKQSIPVFLSNNYLTFRHYIFAIHASKSHINDLKKIEQRLKNKQLYQFFISCTSSYSLTSSSEFRILEKDIMNLPYPEDEKQLLLSDAEKAVMNDVLKYMIKSQSIQGENELSKKVGVKDLQNFSNLFCKALNSVYQGNGKKFRQNKIIRTSAFICNSFSYDGKDDEKINIAESDILHNDLLKLIIQKAGESLYINRIIRIYDKDIIYLIKPDQLRYWLGSIALWDADKTFADLLEDGY